MEDKATRDMINFWNPEDDEELRARIVNPKEWDEVTERHFPYLFDASSFFNISDFKRKKFLEIGCGIGRLMKILSVEVEEIGGLDISARMIDKAGVYLKDIKNCRKLGRIRPTLDYSFCESPETYDVVYSFLVFQHIHDRDIIDKYFKETFRVLKPGGKFRVQTHKGKPHRDGKFHGFMGEFYETADEFAVEIESAGFNILEVQEGLGHKNWIWVTAEKPDRMRGLETGNMWMPDPN